MLSFMQMSKKSRGDGAWLEVVVYSVLFLSEVRMMAALRGGAAVASERSTPKYSSKVL